MVWGLPGGGLQPIADPCVEQWPELLQEQSPSPQDSTVPWTARALMRAPEGPQEGVRVSLDMGLGGDSDDCHAGPQLAI